MRPEVRAAVMSTAARAFVGASAGAPLAQLHACLHEDAVWMKKLRNSENCSPRTSWAAAFAYSSTSELPDPSSISGPAGPSRNQVTGRNSRGTTPSCLNFGYPRTIEILMLQG